MPTLAHFALLAAASTMLLACSARSSVATSDPAATNVTPAAAQTGSTPVTSTDAQGITLQGFNFSLAVSQPFSVTLPGHGTEGYGWHLDPTTDTRIAMPAAASRLGPLPANSALGASAPEIFDFKTGAVGTTTLHFSLYRSWEGADKAAEKRQFGVTVH